MKKICVFLFFIILGLNQSFAQTKTEEDAVKATINLLFDGMRNSDTTAIRKAFAAKNMMETIVINKDGKAIVRTDNLNNFLKSIGAPHPEKYDERIVFTKILIDANLASV